MGKATAILVATIAVVTLLIIGAFSWYHFTGWQTFSYKTGDNPSWMPSSGDVTLLRFKDVKFTVRRSDGAYAEANVAGNLNSMAVGLKGGLNLPPALTLDKPLNPFSFTIKGFNDVATVPNPSLPPWCSSPCPTGSCVNCPGGPAVTLTGKFRTI